MVFSIKLRQEKRQKKVNVEEVFVLWNTLSTDYRAINRMLIWQNYIHDIDLSIILNDFLDEFKKTTKELEEIMEEHSISPTQKPFEGVNTSTNSEVLTDLMIGNWILQLIQEKIELHLRAIRTAITNDKVRKFFFTLVQRRSNQLDTIIKYLRVKGWISQPPFYPNVPVETNEKIDVAEAYHLWDHLMFRYSNMEQTQLFNTFAHDGDFKILLKRGEDILSKQAKILEQELLKFGIPLSVKPRSFEISHDTQILRDQYIFSATFSGMQNAIIIHAQALKESVTNDRVREIFKKLLFTEINIVDDFLKYGKIKGWVNVPPEYMLAK